LVFSVGKILQKKKKGKKITQPKQLQTILKKRPGRVNLSLNPANTAYYPPNTRDLITSIKTTHLCQ
jgi:hypothetical protein